MIEEAAHDVTDFCEILIENSRGHPGCKFARFHGSDQGFADTCETNQAIHGQGWCRAHAQGGYCFGIGLQGAGDDVVQITRGD